MSECGKNSFLLLNDSCSTCTISIEEEKIKENWYDNQNDEISLLLKGKRGQRDGKN